MKKVLLLFCLTFCACSKQEVTPELSVSTSLVTFNAEIGTCSFLLNANTAWNIIPETWCAYTRKNGELISDCDNSTPNTWCETNFSSGAISTNKKIDVSVSENPSYYRRTYNMTVNSAGGLSKKINVVQSGKPYLNIEQTTFEISADAQRLQFGIEIYDGDFEIDVSDTWMYGYGYSYVYYRSDTTLWYHINCYVAPNLSPNEREGIITLTQENLSKTVVVRQAGQQ